MAHQSSVTTKAKMSGQMQMQMQDMKMPAKL